MFSANQIVGFFNQSYLKNKSMNYSDFLYLDKNLCKLKTGEKLFGRLWQKLAWPVWLQDSKTVSQKCTDGVNSFF